MMTVVLAAMFDRAGARRLFGGRTLRSAVEATLPNRDEWRQWSEPTGHEPDAHDATQVIIYDATA
jgi:hypothetical protein